MRLINAMTIASFKMFVRQKEAILWTILLPLFMVFLFSFVSFDGMGSISLGVVNYSGDTTLVSFLKNIEALKITEDTEENQLARLRDGDRSLVLVIPATFTSSGSDSLTLYVNSERPQEAQAGRVIIQRAVDEMVFQQHHSPRPTLREESVNSRNLTYIDFILPGIIAMSIMNSGIFGVAFGFVVLKKRGILRRLLVTPINPRDFIISQVVSRLIILILQVVIMVGAGLLLFDLHFVGSLLDMLVIGILGGIVFLAIGFALSGSSKSEDQVAPLANIVTLPMLFLSGVFFSRSALPGIAHTITGFFPLTYLADGLRNIAIEGATLADAWVQVLGLVVWSIITVTLAIKAFRWE